MSLACHDVPALALRRALDVLDQDDARRLDAHLAGCAACPAAVADATGALAREAGPVDHAPRKDRRARLDAALAARREATTAAPALTVLLRCTYCRDGLGRDDAVYCAGCLAPVHRACREEHGRCAAPGCAETRVLEPRELDARRRTRRWWLLPVVLVAGGAAALTARRVLPDAGTAGARSTDVSTPRVVDLGRLGRGETRRVFIPMDPGATPREPGAELLLGEGRFRLELPVGIGADERALLGLLTPLAAADGRCTLRVPGTGLELTFVVEGVPPHVAASARRREALRALPAAELEATLRDHARRVGSVSAGDALAERLLDEIGALPPGSALREELEPARARAEASLVAARGERAARATAARERWTAARAAGRWDEVQAALEALRATTDDDCDADAQRWLLHLDDLARRGVTPPPAPRPCTAALDPFDAPALPPTGALREPSLDAREGEPWTWDPGVSAAGTVFWLERAPEGMQIDGTTGVVRWTPDERSIGRWDVVVRCRVGPDDEGRELAAFTLRVRPRD